MERTVVMLIPALMAVSLVRMLLAPIKVLSKLLLHTGCGFACLLLINSIAPFTGIQLPINPVTALTAGILGLPGIGVLALLELL